MFRRLWRGLNVFVSLTTIMWSVGIANVAFLLIPVTPALAAPNNLFFDSFPSNNGNVVTGWSEIETNNPYASLSTFSPRLGSITTGHARLTKGASITKTINTAGYGNIKFSYYWHGDDDAESNDYLAVSWRVGTTGSFTPLASHDLSNNSWSSLVEHSLSPNGNNTSIQVRFTAITSQDDEQARVDDVKITGETLAYCGDGTIQSPNGDGINEVCEINQTQTCQVPTNGYTGVQTCGQDCLTWGDCVSQQSCGDNTKNGNEQCDGDDYGSGGKPEHYTCNDDCLLEYVPYCGDGRIIQDVEGCDAGETNGAVCDPGYGSSCTYCSDDCQAVVVDGAYCGDGEENNPPEGCDLGKDNLEIAPDPVWGQNQHDGDQTYCSTQCAEYTVAGTYCGDNIKQSPSEECDGEDGLITGYRCTAGCKLELIGDCEMTLTKTDNVDPVLPGGLVTYTLTLSNIGNGYCTGSGVLLVDHEDSRTTYVSSTTTNPRAVRVNYHAWNYGDVPAGEVNQAFLTFRVKPDVACGTVLTNKACFEAAEYKSSVCINETTTVTCCGDGVKNSGEECDTGSDNGTSCTPGYGTSCTYCDLGCKEVTVQGPYCGDEILQEPEECDAGPDGSAQCSPDCKSAPTCDPDTELIVNGSFENPVVTNPNRWDIFSGSATNWLTGWVSPTPATYGSQTRPTEAKLEIHKSGLFSGSIPAGSQYAELDGDWGGPSDGGSGEPASVKISQLLATWPGYQYQVSFNFSPRPATAASNNSLEFSWDGAPVDTISRAGGSSFDWSSHSYTLGADDYNTVIEFADDGTSDSLGTFLDNVSVRCVPPDQAECGNNVYEPTNNEECDGTANVGEHQGCSEDCKLVGLTYCGDGTKQTPNSEGTGGPVNDGNEECDGEDVEYGYYCTDNCEKKFGRAYCGDQVVNQEWELCDGGELCNQQCQWINPNECNDLVLAKINITGVNNYSLNADMTANIYLGNNEVFVPNNTWFPLYQNGSYLIDDDIAGYEDVAGLAVQRFPGGLRAVIHASHREEFDLEHADGVIEFYNASVTGQTDDEANSLERGFDDSGTGIYPPLAENDEVWSTDNTHSEFWLSAATDDDGFYTNWQIQQDCQSSVCGYKYNDVNGNTEWEESETGLGDWTIQLLQSVACEPGAEWADTVILAEQGKKKDGTPVDANRSIPEQGLILENGQNVSNFFSLGFGGSIVVGFSNAIVDGSGADLKITEDTWGSYPLEKADVYASQDGLSWVLLGTADNTNLNLIHTTSEFDLAGSGLSWAQYVKIVDVSDPAVHTATGDGYDLNAVEAVNCVDRWEVVDTEVTDQTGHYCFVPVQAGRYRVQEVLQTGWTNSTPIYQDLVLGQLEDAAVNFGNYEVPPVCNDYDDDGYYGSGDDACVINDCNDENSAVHPEATETCDGIDNDCDGAVDEDLNCGGDPVCQYGAVRPCITDSQGVCSAGTQTCDEVSQWGTCVQTVQSGTEVCDDLDNDCDGAVDEDLNCGNDGPVCGNQTCETGETCSTCSADCGSCGGGGGGGGGPTGLYIHNEDTDDGVETTSVLITWFTNKPATSRVIYDNVPHSDVTTPPNYGYQWSTDTYNEGPDKTTHHSILITGLIPGTTYYFRPISAASPEVFGKELSYVTKEGEPAVVTIPTTGGEETGTVAGVEYAAPIPEGEPVNPAAPTTGGEETGTVAGVEYQEPTPEAQPTDSNTPTTAEETTANTTNCSTTIWIFFVIDLVALVVIGYQNRNSRSWKRFLWLSGLVVVLLPFIWYPACWLWIWLLVVLVLLIVAAFIKADQV